VSETASLGVRWKVLPEILDGEERKKIKYEAFIPARQNPVIPSETVVSIIVSNNIKILRNICIFLISYVNKVKVTCNRT
jgi:hypothetical protein